MPITLPNLDDRRYQDLLDEALARVPVHNPEWTNFNKSDPGVTLVEIFAFLTESLLYRCNQIPERNRLKFLSLLGVPLQPASSARGLVQFTNERGPRETVTLPAGREVRAGKVPFYTDLGLDVLPVEAQVFYKRKVADADAAQLKDYYSLLYASYKKDELDTTKLELYETVPLDAKQTVGVDLGKDAVGGALWIALLARANDKPSDTTDKAREDLHDEIRKSLAGRTLSLGVVPVLSTDQRTLAPGGGAPQRQSQSLLVYEIPNVSGGTDLPDDPTARKPTYRSLVATAQGDVLSMPGVVQVSLPSNKDDLRLWTDLDPLEPGVGDFPPTLDDTSLNDRVLTWLRVRPRDDAAAQVRLLWVGVNAANVTQRAHVVGEQLPDGTGAPDQISFLSHTPVLPGSVRIVVTTRASDRLTESRVWTRIEDLADAGPEVPTLDPRRPPGSPVVQNARVEVFTLNRESGEIRFGDGTRGKRPPAGATIRAEYDYGVGAAGNVGAGSISTSPALPAGFKVTNPVQTWGGAEAETVLDGEKQIARYLQHRERLVTAADFLSITLRTPGVDIGRVEVLPNYNPALRGGAAGAAAGAVTLMLIPRYDARQPDAPLPDQVFLEAVCRYLEPRRLITTEVFLRGADYVPVWVSVGISVVAGASIAETTDAVRRELLKFLSPLPPAGRTQIETQAALLTTPQYAAGQNGWALGKAVSTRELLAVASRVANVDFVNDVFVARGDEARADTIPMTGLELPRVLGISVGVGDPAPIDSMRGTVKPKGGGGDGAGLVVPVPVIPEEC
ncbi:MAG: baseplate J/gp47 family protein [Acidobacteria bacterium]|nr:baseplate J/gp47 family protein [Acidobacteriota bacterium]